MKGYPKQFYRWFILLATLLWLSGIALSPASLDMRFEYSLPWQLAAEINHHTTTLHALLAFITLWLLGAIWSVHIRANWGKKKNCASGSWLIAVCLVIALSGLGIYYIGEDSIANVTSLTHLLLGGLAPIALIAHLILGKKTKVKPRIKH